ncbi:carboxypeptidase-like regulatory domain-containing protein [Hyalangium versicolor]|uniref:carboxypeptidase-like regulatory domain-containing protein n=1 Tax=Hyalangium versicolor TaxID=2861190 RepID=UPI001CCF38DF|nr:carboxypeptidase-like regulatory domain-containing protein [Hyalangium versicolor]
MKKLVMALVPAMVLGCGESEDLNGDGIADGVQDPNNVSVVVPATPKGTVSGQVLSTSLVPLTDVTVSLTIGGTTADSKKAMTNAEGNFVFSDVPAGAQVLLTFSKQGYATLRATSEVPSSAGNVPINNGNASFGPVTLAQLNGSLRFQVVSPTGQPAAGVHATIEASPAGTVVLGNYEYTPQSVSTVVVEAVSNQDGLLVFENLPSAAELARLPSGSYSLWVSPLDANGDGIPESGGFVSNYPGANVVANSTIRTISLPYARPQAGVLAIENSNVGSLRAATDYDPLRNMVKPGQPIYLYFNQAVQSDSLLVRLTDEYARESLPITATVGNGGYSATLTPGSGVIQEGKEYNLNFRAVSREGGSVLSPTSAFFFGGEPANSPPVSITEVRYQETVAPPAAGATQINNGEKVYVNFSAPLARTFSGAVYAQVFFNADIDGNGSIGKGSRGEVGNDSGEGFDLIADEPTGPYQTSTNRPELPVFSIAASGYTTRYSFTFTTTLTGGLSAANFPLTVAFSKLPFRTTGTYQSIWGEPITGDLSATTAVQQPAPVNTP